MSDAKTEYVGRQVIENKLLTALEDKDSVAAIFTESDLDLLIQALGWFASEAPNTLSPKAEKALEFRKDLQSLKEKAFPK